MKAVSYMIFYLLVLSLLTGCNNKKDNITPEFKLHAADCLDDNEYQIYSLILNDIYQSSNYFVVKQKTSVWISISPGNMYYESLLTDVPNLDSTIFTDYISKNDTAYYMDNRFTNLTKSVTLISGEEIQYFFTSRDINDGWGEFYKKYPGSHGMIDFARVGFNADEDQAVVDVGHYYASLGAAGLLIYLVRDNSGWRIIKTINTWIS